MELPFSESQFLDVFGNYNRGLWPAVIALWLVTVGVVIRLRRGPAGASIMTLLAAHWLWSAVAYHWFYFRTINPAGAVFAGLFAAQGLIFAWAAVSRRGEFTVDRSPRSFFGVGLVCYGLLYPFLGFAFGLQYPRMPLFAVPCPTTLVTAGLLLMVSGVPREITVVPIMWTAIGSSAAIVLGIRADLALVVAGALLILDTLAPRVLGSSGRG